MIERLNELETTASSRSAVHERDRRHWYLHLVNLPTEFSAAHPFFAAQKTIAKTSDLVDLARAVEG